MNYLSTFVLSFFLSLNIFAEQKPNVILIMADDLGYGDLSANGNTLIKTPNLDAFREESARLERFYMSPTCSLTRAALMTGRWPFSVGVNHTVNGRSILREGIPTIADAFQTGGYSTGIFGKWHLGDNVPHLPRFRGFSESYIHLGGGIGQSPDYWGNTYFDSVFHHNGKPVKSRGFCTTVLMDKSLEWIKKQKANEKPFFLYLPTNVPHGPWEIKQEWAEELLKAGCPPNIASFYATIQHLDNEIGRLLQTLQKEGLDQNTIVIFTSDNGTTGRGYNAGMKGHKGTVDEGGVRIPFWIRWPGKIKTRELNQPVGHIDVFPTLCQLCQIDIPKNAELDGLDWSKWLLGGNMFEENRFWFSHNGRWKERETPSQYRTRNFAVRDSRYRLVGTQLFDMQKDPGQKTDIFAEKPEVAHTMLTAYDAWWKKVSQDIYNPVRIILGDEREDVARLCAHDWYSSELVQDSESAPKVWSQEKIRNYLTAMNDPKSAVNLPTLMGHWKVKFKRSGRYRFTLYKLPPEALQTPDKDLAILNQGTGHLTIGHFTAELAVNTEGMTSASIDLDIDAGEQEIETWWGNQFADTKKPLGCFFVDVERIGEKTHIFDPKFIK